MGDVLLTPTEDKKDANKSQYNLQKRRKLTAASGQRCECCVCGEHFNKTATFEAHRVGSFGAKNTRRCLTVREMALKNFTKTQDDYWLAPISEKAKEYFKGLRAKNDLCRPIIQPLIPHKA